MDSLRSHLVALLRGGQAYDRFEDVVESFAPEERDMVPLGAEHSAWEIVAHMRITLRDILDYSKNDDGSYRELDWPREYWPEGRMPNGGWEEAIRGYLADRDELEAICLDTGNDLFRPFPWAEQHTLLREILLACDHAGYHIGELVELKRWLNK